MNRSGGTFSKDGDRATQLSNVALLYYGEGLTQSEIAKRLQVSRVTVVNLLRDARDEGIVEIHVSGRHLTESSLSRDLRDKFGLEDVYISDTFNSAETDRAAVLRQLGRVAATAFLNVVEPGDKIGVAWGETVLALCNALPRARVEGVEVSQLIGSMISDRVPASETCAIQIANQIGARCFTLHAPAIVSTVDLARALRLEPTIAAQMNRLRALDMVVSSIGNVSKDTHLVAAGMATPGEAKAAEKAGAKGVICCRYIDAQGQECALPPSDRVVTTSLKNLRAARKIMLVVCGEDRADATRAAIAGGFATHLCVDRGLAAALLQSNS
ncbi:sugar-binding domain-containing protein [uncultured Roseobacter sp.]|uniref:sugar-binding transcriptional regulator n=1 Tax=uncultured Roseobacter sp. TaxID=114847 RepID=UPI002622BE61|nr:sugar-binding domain-containing protein [uncultured Roseobacter sp.]